MTAAAVRNAAGLCYIMPEDGNHITIPETELFGILSEAQTDSLRRHRSADINGVRFRVESESAGIITLLSDEGARMQVDTTGALPLIVSMTGNPLEIDWTVERRAPGSH